MTITRLEKEATSIRKEIPITRLEEEVASYPTPSPVADSLQDRLEETMHCKHCGGITNSIFGRIDKGGHPCCGFCRIACHQEDKGMPGGGCCKGEEGGCCLRNEEFRRKLEMEE